MKLMIDQRETQITRRRYQRISAIYDIIETLAETKYHPWREHLWAGVRGPEVLEVGVGTGKNMPFYPDHLSITAIDLTPGMLVRAQKKKEKLGLGVDLHIGDVQKLDFNDDTFDAAVATFVFCSVPDPIGGLKELQRVVKSGGQIILMEHVRSGIPLLGAMMDILNPMMVRIIGANINRPTVDNVRRAGVEIERVEHLGRGDIFKLIHTRNH